MGRQVLYHGATWEAWNPQKTQQFHLEGHTSESVPSSPQPVSGALCAAVGVYTTLVCLLIYQCTTRWGNHLPLRVRIKEPEAQRRKMTRSHRGQAPTPTAHSGRGGEEPGDSALSSPERPSLPSGLQNGLTTRGSPVRVSSDYVCYHHGGCLLLTGEVPRDLRSQGAWPILSGPEWGCPSRAQLSPQAQICPPAQLAPVSCRHNHAGTAAAALLEALPRAGPPLALLRPGRLPGPVWARAAPRPLP